jgi:hypothetical protein
MSDELDSLQALMAEYAAGGGPARTAEEIQQKAEAIAGQFADTPEELLRYRIAGAAGESAAGGAATGVVGELVASVVRAIPDAIQKLVETIATGFTGAIKSEIDKWVTAGLFSPEAASELGKIVDRRPVLGMLFSYLAMGLSYVSYYGHMLRASNAEATQQLNIKMRPGLPDAGSMIRAAMVSPGREAEVREVLARLGYTEKHIDLMYRAMWATLTVDQAMRLRLRGVLDEEGLLRRMREMGYTDAKTAEIRKLYEVLPSVQDIIYMVGKEAFEPDQIARFGLGDEFPALAVPYAEAQGLSREWLERYWYAHWTHASPQQVLEMLHRGVVTEKDVYEYYRVVEVPPWWREKLMAISFSPYTRVDTRRMYEMGIIDETEVYRNYLDQGYDADKAAGMLRFSMALKHSKDKELSVSEILGAYKLGLLVRSVVISYLTEAGYSTEEAEFKVDYVEYQKKVAEQKERIDLIGSRYKGGYITEPEALDALRELDLTEAVVQEHMGRWKLDYEKTLRRPSKAELDKLVGSGIISPAQYVFELEKLGYRGEHIGWFVQLALAELEGG